MNKFLLVSVVTLLIVPCVLAEKGSGDMGKPMPPPMPPMEQNWDKMNEGPHSEMKLPPMMGSGEVKPPMMGSGAKRPPMMGSGDVRPPMMGNGEIRRPVGSGSVKPPMGSGASLEQEMKWLQLAMGKLTPEQRKELLKLIRDYLTSKGVTTPSNNENNGGKRPVMPLVKKMMENKKEWEKTGSGKPLPPPTLPPPTTGSGTL